LESSKQKEKHQSLLKEPILVIFFSRIWGTEDLQSKQFLLLATAYATPRKINKHTKMEIITTDFIQESLQVDQDATNSAVYVRNAQKSYGIGKRRSNILQLLNMTVKKGTM
jgi:hypothetical protein